MKFLASLFAASLLASTALAQSAVIGSPAPGAIVKAGSNITVEVDRPDTLTGSTEVDLIIGFLSCNNINFPTGVCPPASEILGTILYNGPYDPEFRTSGKPPYQNFTVQIPADANKGSAQLSVTHFSLVGAGPFPLLEVLNVTVQVV
ncbi:hypothetical protein FB45DRAFT_1006451 [Roridomyces roridus]|uniref:Phosphatidylglycerol/phosphatidylinositol transfer protein n=1 Tax=Roridomyces roridus TaxID=1738132 RepID=A0AAD7BHN5_9AGAR|nr:hypothetical protein FB45DRAFT_1006451 [Roridomyces roridus]